MRISELARVSEAVAATRSRLAKRDLLAGLLRGLGPDEVPVAVSYLVGELPQGRIGVGPAAVRAAAGGGGPNPEPGAGVTVEEAHATFDRIAGSSGPGSGAERTELLAGLFRRADSAERRFLARLLLGELRQGALEGVMVDGVAAAADVPVGSVRRAAMLSGDLPGVARTSLAEGREGLERVRLRLFRPIQPMLAQSAEGVGDALASLGRAGFEHKLDGARVQVHRQGDEVRVYSRRLHEVTPTVPEVVEAVLALPARELVLDGEVIALRADGRPHPFQVTMRRFGRRLDVARMRRQLPLTPVFFDCLARDGDELLTRPGAERVAALRGLLPAELVVPRVETDDPEEAAAFLARALERGHEGVMAKSLGAPYEAGSRGAAWLKVKPTHTLDLVVLAAEWGSGRRRGWLSNLHLGARDPEGGGFVMLGKTFKGMTDEMLAWQTERLQELAVGEAPGGGSPHVVRVRPELVVEVAFDGVQESPQYPGGMALRFARVKGHRPDKGPEDADTVETVREIFRSGRGAG